MTTTNFRIQYKTVGLTYSYSSDESCTFSYEKQRLLDFLVTLPIDIGDYYIVKELHKDGNPHLHAWLELDAKPNIRNPRFFDCDGCHPNIGKYKRNWVHNYLRKFDREPLTNIASGYIQLAQEGETKRAIEAFQRREPRSYVINMVKVNQNLRALGQKVRPARAPFPYSDYIDVPLYNDDKKCLIIQGPTDIGKTSFAKSYCVHKNWTYKVISQIDDLRTYAGEDCIIFDDVSFAHTPRNNQIKVAEIEQEASIHCRYSDATIPWGVKRIFTCNPGHMPLAVSDPAIDRRCFVWNVSCLRK